MEIYRKLLKVDKKTQPSSEVEKDLNRILSKEDTEIARRHRNGQFKCVVL